MTVAKLPPAKDLEDYNAADINEALVRELAEGGFIAPRRAAPQMRVPRNVVLVGDTGPGKTHGAIAIARVCIRRGARARFFTIVDLVNQLDAETRTDRQDPIADQLCRLDFVVTDAPRYPPIASPAGACRSISSASSAGAPRSS
jgi:DNA replication protein DnaC